MKCPLIKAIILSSLVAMSLGCKSLSTSTMSSGLKESAREFGLGEVYVMPITDQLISLLPHLSIYKGHILLGNLHVQMVVTGMKGASQKVHDQKILRVYKHSLRGWDSQPFEGVKFAIGHKALTDVEDILFSPVAETREAGMTILFRQGSQKFEMYISLGASAQFAAIEFRSAKAKSKVSKFSMIFSNESTDVFGPEAGERGQALGFYQGLDELSVVSLQPYTLKKNDGSIQLDIKDPELKYEFLLFFNAPELQMATTAALIEGQYGRLKIKCANCALPVGMFVLSEDKQPLFKLTATPVLERNFVVPVGRYLISEDSLGHQLWSQQPVEIKKDQEHVYQISNQGASRLIVNIDPPVNGDLASFELFKKDSAKGQPYMVINEPERLVNQSKIITEKKVLNLTLPNDQYTARLISREHGKLCEFDIASMTDKTIEKDCVAASRESPPQSWLSQHRDFEKISFTEARFRWPVTIYPVSRATKEVWLDLFADRQDIQLSEARDFFSLRKDQGLLVLGCPDFSRTLSEFDMAVKSLRPDAVEIFGCNLRYEFGLYMAKVVDAMNDLKRNIVFVSPDENMLNRLPPKIAVYHRDVPQANDLERWTELMRRGEYSLVWGSQMRPANEDAKSREVEIRNLPGARPQKIIFHANNGKVVEVPIAEASSMEMIKEKVPKFPRASWWRAEVWGSWGQSPNANKELSLLGATNFQKNF